MNIFKNFTNRLNTIYSYLSGSNTGSYIIYNPSMATTKSGETISTEQAIGETTILTCIKIICQGIAQLPIKAENYENVLYNPNVLQTRYDFIYSIIHSYLAYGNAYIFIVRDKQNRARKLITLDPSIVTINTNKYGIPIYRYNGEKNPFNNDDDEKKNPFIHDNIIHIKDISTFEVQGKSRILLAKERIGCLKASDRQIAENFNNGIDIKYSISVPNKFKDEKQQKEFNAKINELFGRSGAKRGGAITISKDTEIKQYRGMNVADTDLREIRSKLIKEIASLMGVPAYMVGEDGDQKYSNVRQSQTALYRDTYLPIITAIEQAFDKKGISIKFDVNDLLKGDIESQARVMTQMVQSGILTPNEARIYVGYEKIEDPNADLLQRTKTLGIQDQRGSEMEPNQMNTEITNNDGRDNTATNNDGK